MVFDEVVQLRYLVVFVASGLEEVDELLAGGCVGGDGWGWGLRESPKKFVLPFLIDIVKSIVVLH